MTGAEIVGFIQSYADTIAAPVEAGTTVTTVRPIDDGYEVVTDQGTWRCRCVVLAGGACNLPSIPDFAAAVPARCRPGQPARLPESRINSPTVASS